jgi:hypothetical protein
MIEQSTDRHELAAQVQSLAREIEALSTQPALSQADRRRIAEMKILHLEMTARLQAVDRG